jgi:hypothetical protein
MRNRLYGALAEIATVVVVAYTAYGIVSVLFR